MGDKTTLSLHLHAGGKKENRRELDFYPTPPDVTIALMNMLRLGKSVVWEPACGDMAMSDVIKSFGHEVISTDIIHGADFFETTIKCDAIITNPPFALSEGFIRKALKEADIVCMLLKGQYWHAKKRFPLFMENKPTWVLPLTWRPDFMGGERGGAPTMEVAWTVWIKGFHDCKYMPLERP